MSRALDLFFVVVFLKVCWYYEKVKLDEKCNVFMDELVNFVQTTLTFLLWVNIQQVILFYPRDENVIR